MNILNEYTKITDLIGEQPIRHEKIAQSYNLSIFKLEFKNHAPIVAKFGAPILREHFKLEHQMLQQLNTFDFLASPNVIYQDDSLYLMEYIEHISLGHHQEVEPIIAQQIAQLHQITNNKFGFEYDTLIGPLLQPNRWHDNWIDFFIQNRLIYFSDQCYEKKLINTEFRHKIDILIDKLPGLLSNNNRPCLIHGDLWYGNILSSGHTLKAFIDPALYYANPEIELAYVTMHNSLGKDFFGEYQQFHTIEDGFFDVRKDIYNVYPNLVHILLCGSDYALPIEQVFKRHGI